MSEQQGQNIIPEMIDMHGKLYDIANVGEKYDTLPEKHAAAQRITAQGEKWDSREDHHTKEFLDEEKRRQKAAHREALHQEKESLRE